LSSRNDGDSVSVLFIQTSDPFRYRDMLADTARTVGRYCQDHGFDYESYIGIKRGKFAWHATFNRMLMLSEILTRGYRGWVIYLDADAFVADLDFDLTAYLADKIRCSAILVSLGSGPEWAVNAGVFMINLGHEDGRRIVERWAEKFAEISDSQLAAMEIWDDRCSDQSMLYEVLDEDESIRRAIIFESRDLINGEKASFIRQVLRAYYPSLDARIAVVRLAVADIMGDKEHGVLEVAPVIVSAFYRSILHRDPDAGGLDHFVQAFHSHGIEVAIRNMLSSMLSSGEYQSLGRH
jgi:hypothetical protein